MTQQTEKTEKFCHANPMVPAAALFLLGIACGGLLPAGTFLTIAIASWIGWLALERVGLARAAQCALAGVLLAGAGCFATLNQHNVEPQHIARFAENQEKMILARATVEVPPGETTTFGNKFWIARITEIRTNLGWIAAQGDVQMQWTSGGATDLHRGAKVELYGWLSRPVGALNPGAIDPRRNLAADRIFAQIRVPRPGGVRVLQDVPAARESWIGRMRLYLRGKLLEHTIREDVPAAYALTALLLGYRDPAIGDVSQAFADAGVAHLLAISGSHIVFFSGIVWGILRFVPMRPRWRELVILVVLGMYVLATPCGPPIVRAAVGLVMVVVARMLGRPREYLNMLAGAAVIVVLLRPMDINDAGFQLSFVTTAGLILFSRRIHAALFEKMLARETLAAELGRTRWAWWRLRLMKGAAVMVTANAIGAVTAGPLVALHFGQVNLWAVATGIVALPFVSAAMVVAAGQLLAEIAGLGAWIAPLSAMCGREMIWVVGKLAELPGAAMPLRAPPAWLVAVMYGVLLMWAMRRRLGVSRAMVVNAAVACGVVTVGWYAWSVPGEKTRMTVLSAGDGACILVRTSSGIWAIDAGNGQGFSLVKSAVGPALRVAGVRRLKGLVVADFLPGHAREAGELVGAYGPGEVWVPAEAWERRGETLAGAQIEAAAKGRGVEVKTLREGDVLRVVDGFNLEVLEHGQSVAFIGDFRGKRVLIADPSLVKYLNVLPVERVRCDVAILTGPRRGAAVLEAREFAGKYGVGEVIWCGGAAGAALPAGERDTVDGAVEVFDF